MSKEILLQKAWDRSVVRVGDTVRRPTWPWSESVHDLLRYLEERQWPFAPRFLGLDDEGRETLSWIDGASGSDGWRFAVSESGVRALGVLLRSYHDVVAEFEPRIDAAWATHLGKPRDGHVVCHNDFGPWNVVWRDNVPVALIDWDYAEPEEPLDEVASALEYLAPYRSDDECLGWLTFSEVPDRRRRTEVLLEAYGVGGVDAAEIFDRVVAAQQRTYDKAMNLALRGLIPQATWLRDGQFPLLAERIEWTLQHRHLFA